MVIPRKRPTLGHSNASPNRTLASKGSKIKDLLSDEDTIQVSKDTQAPKECSEKILDFSNFVITPLHYDYPRIGRVPATYYRSQIVDMRVREKDGHEILDVHYDIEDGYGRKFYIKQSYRAGSQPFYDLADALAAAGTPTDTTIDAGIGVTEIIEIDYITPKSNLGSITNRRPCPAPATNNQVMDEDEYEEAEGDEEE